MQIRPKKFNSKAFLLIYLVVVVTMLMGWVGHLAHDQTDNRELPPRLAPFLLSPPQDIPQFLLNKNNKQVLTNSHLLAKWSFVYFSYGHCLPGCNRSLQKISTLRKAFANPDIQFVIIGIDSEHETAEQLNSFVHAQNLKVTTATADTKMIEAVTRAFHALFIQTDYADGRYRIEQQDDLFLVDPKGRVYARFKANVPSEQIQSLFPALRLFYARSE